MPTIDPAGAGLKPAGDGMMWLDGRFQTQLQQAGMARFEAVMEHRGGLCLRVLEDRENWYFAPQRDDGRSRRLLEKTSRADMVERGCGRSSAAGLPAPRPPGPRPAAPARSLRWASTSCGWWPMASGFAPTAWSNPSC